MAKVVIDVLEPVKVNKQNRDTALEPAGRQQCLTQAVKEQCPVRKAGQHIMNGQMAHACFGLFAFGNVGIGRDIAAARHRIVINLNNAPIGAGAFHAIGFAASCNGNTIGIRA